MKPSRPCCGSRSGRQGALHHQTREKRETGFPSGSASLVPGCSRLVPVRAGMALCAILCHRLRLATPCSPSPHPQRWPAPRDGYGQSGQAVRLASPPSDQWLGKVALTGVPRAPEPGRGEARLSRSQGRAPDTSPSPPPPEGAEQRCFVLAAATSTLGRWDWGRVVPSQISAVGWQGPRANLKAGIWHAS